MDTLSEPVFRWTLGGLLVAGLGLRAYFQHQARGVDRVGRRGGRRDQVFYGLVLGSYLLMFVYVFTPWLDGAHIMFPAWVRWSGALLAAAGVGLFCWSHLALGANWSGIVELARGHRLVMEGPYRYVRHPMYSAFFVMGFGLLLLSANWLLGLIHIYGSPARDYVGQALVQPEQARPASSATGSTPRLCYNRRILMLSRQ